ncbi:MAG: hypothetical protein COV07_02580 [Candidatus Vogelbacteria bacterium CG10_big_fil_rev_8_21_14_0_10_45_14]|uniref:Uncharacterized protein n=1 Tax=Candidatus Vogelbacteria bacterium CG10_big_fil_rev_8_21_14_0_10_45_14 TaxID=1975042 RepID=A0A2H0RJQ8_9BACT|nr:MAG: hypothetical protein COV07_02580 [Candidatus Vogelbacteria bacterium CG10_big_fil_rev_8_21_14_0_10_45_14]
MAMPKTKKEMEELRMKQAKIALDKQRKLEKEQQDFDNDPFWQFAVHNVWWIVTLATLIGFLVFSSF